MSVRRRSRPALVDVLAYRGGQLGLHQDDADFQRNYGVLRYFLNGLHQRQVDVISNMITYRATHADQGNTLDTRRIADWAARHAQVALN